MTSSSTYALQAVPVIQADRLQRLQRELAYAWDQTSRDDVIAWSITSGKGFVGATARRARNILRLVKKAAKFVGTESVAGYAAWEKDRLQSHLLNRVNDAGNSLVQTYRDVTVFTGQIAQAFKDDPKNAAVQLLTLVITSLAVSGGPDGDGGAPDLDLAFGIDAHRSILSHSILMGAALEAGILALLGVVKLTHHKLPDDHDAIWDAWHVQAMTISHAASMGVSVGMAYHLLVDGLVQPAPYHDLPVSMPIEGHQTIFVVNGIGEVMDTAKKPVST